ncbi:hypothetical protein SPRG_06970 [Saprolegnia parasitica CBS 223.65]|uniref:3-oxo-5-alpha-steroid 4-dehydrogenase C-terminal domain-containing protein n=1 Tax=Saprolegnia parasitica (strain CBS 223.65) TaxID=695850 RepID=A0A067CA57_SAPPC|nr:hypothetical protein SPRG_06970 [Saprolegnia parasitica CBS 223.65]KDO27383.1 hypothetical protein SPRG_06970 [Saprolegnia parasitica CBS 223.65]|eukprot:XP_012201823.1 hypothetical protein SPRG_06970 [Saprolegnia parasitica CBS 223.65]
MYSLPTLCYAWIAVALVAFVLLQFVTAPFGRHTSTAWGPMLNNKVGWCLMELPSLLLMGGCAWREYLYYDARPSSSYAWVLYILWIAHYTNRSIVYPLRIAATPKPMPVLIVLCACGFNLVNAGLNGAYLLHASAATVLGLLLFVAGMAINCICDTMLIRLRKPNETGYKIPRGFLFELISCPNLFGECVEWAGFGLMAWNPAATTFVIWTVANLMPRAASHHAWYQSHFKDYPRTRKAIVPFVF